MSNLTIRDIAQMAGVSATAVSFVLNNKPGVSEATREKVQEIIKTTGFTPNVHTRRLNLGKSFTIHVVLRQYDSNLFNQFAMETLSGIFKASRELGYSIIFTFVYEDMSYEQIIESVRSKDCDGVILNQVSDSRILSQLRQENIPFVCVDAHIPKDGALPLVEVDYYDAAYQATNHLIDCGHKQIGFLGLNAHAEFYMNTFKGYADALKEHGLVVNPDWLFQSAHTQKSVEACVDKLLQQAQLPTAFLCTGDAFAVEVVRCAKHQGLRVPEDLSIISLDDLLISRYLDPPLSSMTFDKEQLGQQAMNLLYRIIHNEPYEAVNLIQTTLAERQSVKTLK